MCRWCAPTTRKLLHQVDSSAKREMKNTRVTVAFAVKKTRLLISKSRLGSKFAGEELGSTVSERPVFVGILRY
jgi:hypothetical protein